MTTLQGQFQLLVIPEDDGGISKESLLPITTTPARIVAQATLKEDLRHGYLWAAWWAIPDAQRAILAKRLRELADYLESRGQIEPPLL